MTYPIKGSLEINKDMVQILLMLEIFFTQGSEAEDLFCGASSVSEATMSSVITSSAEAVPCLHRFQKIIL